MGNVINIDITIIYAININMMILNTMLASEGLPKAANLGLEVRSFEIII